MSQKTFTRQILPAEPGYSAGIFLDDEIDLDNAKPDDIEEWVEPIICWAISVEFDANGEPISPHSVIPVGVKGDISPDMHIRFPDGRIKRHFDTIPVSVDEAKAQFLAERRAGIR